MRRYEKIRINQPYGNNTANGANTRFRGISEERKSMKKIMFVCHGNICRSPMAEFVMKKLVGDAGLADEFYIASAATSTEEIGNPVYPPAREELHRHGLSAKGKYAVQLKASDYDRYDLFVTMDDWNMRNIRYIFRDDPEGKIHKLLTYAGRGDDVSDPWYTRKFDVAYTDILEGCRALFTELTDREAP